MARKNILKQTFAVEIEVDVNEVKKKYPNYQFNFSSPKQLIEMVASDMKFIGGTNMSRDGMKKFGYSIKVKTTM